MTKADKAALIDELTKKLEDNNYFYVTDASGLTVAEINKFRAMCFNLGIEYKVAKNTLIKKALERMEVDYTPFDESVLKGFSGLLFTKENSSGPAKVLKQFRKEISSTSPILKGASIDSALYIGDEHLDALSKLKSKEELIGDIIFLLQSPANNVLSALTSGKNKLAGIVKTLSEKES